MGLARLGKTFIAALGIAAFASGCASSGTPRPFPGAPGPPATTTPAPTADAPTSAPASRSAVAETALSFRGVPYRNGGSDPKGFDCSGLVQYAFARHGISLPRGVREQLRLGREVRLAGIEKGDLIFFAIGATDASHVGVAIGGDEFVHAPNARGVVRVEKFSAPYWSRRIVGVRRIN